LTWFVTQKLGVPTSAGSADESLELRLPDELTARLEHQIGKPIVLGLRPEHIKCLPPPATASSGTEARAVVELVQSLGSETLVHLVTAGQSFIARAHPGEHVELKRSITVDFDLRQARFFDGETGEAIGRMGKARQDH
jgi:multiple sugar transport system ATP-binding protein